MTLRTEPKWRDIATAPDLERVLVAGWKRPNGSTRGYWYWHEDVCEGGKAIETPNATLWCPIVIPPFPEDPK